MSAFASFREWFFFLRGSEFGPNPEIPASPVIQLRPRPDYQDLWGSPAWLSFGQNADRIGLKFGGPTHYMGIPWPDWLLVMFRCIWALIPSHSEFTPCVGLSFKCVWAKDKITDCFGMPNWGKFWGGGNRGLTSMFQWSIVTYLCDSFIPCSMLNLASDWVLNGAHIHICGTDMFLCPCDGCHWMKMSVLH